MFDIFGFLMLFSFLGLIIGLIKPRFVMWFGLPKKRSAALLLYLSLTLLFMVLFGATAPIPLTDHSTKLNDTTKNVSQSTAPKNYIPTDEDYYDIYKVKIDSVETSYKHGDISFSDYGKSIDTLLSAIDYTINERRNKKLKVFKLSKLYKKSQSIEIQNTAAFLIYGPGDDITLRASAEEFLNENAFDPGSVNIQKAFKSAKSKYGWIYYVRYRAKNAYGALILTDVKLLMRYNNSSGMYDIVKAY